MRQRPYACRDRVAVSARSPAIGCFAIGERVTTSIDRQIALELGVREEQVTATVALLDGGSTIQDNLGRARAARIGDRAAPRAA